MIGVGRWGCPGFDYSMISVTTPEPTEPVEGEDARTAADTTCIN